MLVLAEIVRDAPDGVFVRLRSSFDQSEAVVKVKRGNVLPWQNKMSERPPVKT